MTNKKHIIIAVLLILLGVAIFALAGGSDNSTQKEVNLYFFDESGYTITPVETEIVAVSDTELYEKVAKALIDGPTEKKYLPIMNKDVKLNYVNFVDGNLTVDFSREYPEDNLMCTYAVIKTFSRFFEVKNIHVTENGKGIKGSDGLELGFVTGDYINTESDEDTATGVRLYFTNAEKIELVMEYRKINIVDTKPVEQYIVSELIKGPKIKGNERLLASDTKVLSVETTDRICYVNFKDGFLEKNAASSGKSKLVVDSVVKSLTGLNNVDSVQFLIDGKKTEKFGDTDISGLFVKETPKPEIITE
ncbi:MAG: GerMN domain-containing protein [Clostridia bacterium]|nr:GerMN domain-containing protein [Clostridia bacterium]